MFGHPVPGFLESYQSIPGADPGDESIIKRVVGNANGNIKAFGLYVLNDHAGCACYPGVLIR